MASQRRIAVLSYLLLFIMMAHGQSVAPAGKLGRRIARLEEKIKALEEMCMNKCKPCKFDFEDGTLGDWVKTGTVFDNQPTYGDNPTARNRGQPANQQGDYWIGGAEDRPTPDDEPGEMQGDGPKGNLTSPFFKITGRYITFLIGGGCDENLVRAELIIESELERTVERKVTGKCTETMERVTWDVMEFYGQKAQIRLVDNSSGIWGHINFDDLKGDMACDLDVIEQ